jgi:omega-6 fatty acid desaturase (delta-12 desaturase)
VYFAAAFRRFRRGFSIELDQGRTLMSATAPTPEVATKTVHVQVTPSEPTVPSVKEVRDNFNERAHAKSTFKGVSLFVVSYIPYVLGWWGFVVLQGWWWKIAMAAVITGAIPVLFVISHDACHQALTPLSWLNKIIGRIAMLPAWHAYHVWDYGHNGLHHGWTNLRTKDHVWIPLTKAEYDALPAWKRAMQRMYRTGWGVGLYYFVEMWMLFGMLRAKTKNRKKQLGLNLDRASVLLNAIVMTWLGVFVANRTGLGSNWWVVSGGLWFLSVIGPFILWNWLMGFLVFQHHTHPKVPFYGNADDWSFYAGQVQSVVHIEMPRPIELVLHNIMEHTAHHVDTRIPLYNLENAQKDLEKAYGADLVVFPFTWRGYFNTLRVCRLFDYENFRWLDWDGTPTTESLLRREDSHGKVVRTVYAEAIPASPELF